MEYADDQQSKSDSVDFVMMPRSIERDYENHLITGAEWAILHRLFARANFTNGQCVVNYDGLAKEMEWLVRGHKDQKNFFNKRLTALKRKKYIYFDNQQGRRGAFVATLNNYLLHKGQRTNVDRLCEEDERRSRKRSSGKPAAEQHTEVQEPEQKSEALIDELAHNFSATQNTDGRSVNNNNKNNNELSFPVKSVNNDRDVNPRDYIPKSDEEARCREMAMWLEERTISFVLSGFKKFGLPVLEEAFAITQHDHAAGKVRRKGAYFNRMVAIKAQTCQSQQKSF